jgi:threonine aldolase
VKWVDLRSDTVTQPTPEMRRAMAEAEVGDDVYGDDPTVNRLQAMAAELMGKEAAILVPSGTMGNLASILAHCNRGDEMILGDRAHTYIYEAGGAAALGGVHPRTVPTLVDGRLPLPAIEAAIRPLGDAHYPVTRLICLENTHNLCGGAVLDVEYMQAVGALVHERGLKLHLDGARIFNAAAELGVPATALADPFDSVTFCLSKALCAPVGSLVCGSRDFIERVHRVRKMLGGGMRQAGVLAAAGIVALDEMVGRLAEDHDRAKRLAEGLGGLAGIQVDNDPPQSNMVYLNFGEPARQKWPGLKEAMAERGIKVSPREGMRMRLVTHFWIDDEAIERTIEAFRTYFGA